MEWLLWIDIETTGLDADKDKIIQIACVLTDFSLNIKHILPEIVLSCDQNTLNNMDDWCKKHHQQILEQVQSSCITCKDAEDQIIMFINSHVALQDSIYIAGNSVHFDKHFIKKRMPTLHTRFSHRIVDVSTLALILRNECPEYYQKRPIKKYHHTSMSDILESVAEYEYYLQLIQRSEKNVC
jgi:oligoribonuclease